jgi:type I restriction enzyme, R subunit
VNRVFKDKPGGLVVDYLGLANELRKALVDYTQSGRNGQIAVDQEEAVSIMQKNYEICCNIFDRFDWSAWSKGTPQERLTLLPTRKNMYCSKWMERVG